MLKSFFGHDSTKSGPIYFKLCTVRHAGLIQMASRPQCSNLQEGQVRPLCLQCIFSYYVYRKHGMGMFSKVQCCLCFYCICKYLLSDAYFV